MSKGKSANFNIRRSRILHRHQRNLCWRWCDQHLRRSGDDGDIRSPSKRRSSWRLYYVNSSTNLGYIYIDDGVAWQRANVISLADLTGNLDNVADGTTYGKVKLAELTAGQVNRISDGTNTVTAATANTHINDATKHRLINDAGLTVTDLWSAQKVNNAIELAKH